MKTHRHIDVNCDCGELSAQVAAGVDDDLARTVTSINIACGGHAGDDSSMTRLVRVASSVGTRIGAHPSYPDTTNFGRVTMPIASAALRTALHEQIARLRDICTRENAVLTHIKPHGALYHDCADPAIAAIVAEAALAAAGRDVALVAAATSPAAAIWRSAGFRVMREGFADRAYEADGSLRARRLPGALLSTAAAAQQAVLLASQHSVLVAGQPVPVPCDTICVHGDGPDALATVRAVVAALRDAGITVAAAPAS